ncbi:MAG TPA: hypothetical protein VJ938_12550 [Acidimicrobiia bacterium]|nr:hypothetical protein [Acidimicrobiia bacterium]
MSGPSVVVLAALLTAILLGVVGALVWQEGRRRPGSQEVAYVIDEAVRFVSARLPVEVRKRLRGGGVKRIIEWEVFYLQGLAQKHRRNPVETVAGGSDASVDYIVDRIAVVNGATYDRGDVAEVLRLEAEYLMSIGAVGEPVDLTVDHPEEGKDEA